MRVKRLIYDVCHPLLKVLRTNRTVIRLIFGVRVPRGVPVQFDPTTVLLKHALQQIVTPDDRVALELGIGQGAMVGLSLALGKGIRIDGVDCSPQRVLSSCEVAKFNGVEAHFFQSDLFSNVSPERRYDLIFFNPPYVPTAIGRQLKLTRRLQIDGDQVWDGGSDGTTVLREFLRQSRGFLSSAGRVVFGVQPLFVPEDKVREVIAGSELRLIQRVTKRFVPSVVYVLGHRQLEPRSN